MCRNGVLGKGFQKLQMKVSEDCISFPDVSALGMAKWPLSQVTVVEGVDFSAFGTKWVIQVHRLDGAAAYFVCASHSDFNMCLEVRICHQFALLYFLYLFSFNEGCFFLN